MDDIVQCSIGKMNKRKNYSTINHNLLHYLLNLSVKYSQIPLVLEFQIQFNQIQKCNSFLLFLLNVLLFIMYQESFFFHVSVEAILEAV